MEMVIILGHGSKKRDTEEILNSLINKTKKLTGNEHIYPAFLQFSDTSLDIVIKELIEKGAKKIKIVPMFIFNGVHVTTDIPEEIARINSIYPDIEIKLCKHIGDDDKLAAIIADRISE